LHRKGRLDGWKEIAGYLNVTVRTAQRKETEGLPVHRKGRTIFAYLEEIDLWLKGHPSESVQTDESPQDLGRGSLRKSLLVVVVAIIVLGTSVTIVIWLAASRAAKASVSSLSLNGKVLTALSQENQMLWEIELDGCLITPEGHDRTFSESRKTPTCVTDLDNDGRQEILVTMGAEKLTTENWRLECLDHRGNRRWIYSPAEHIRWQDVEARSPWFLEFDVADLDGDGNREVVVYSRHSHFFPGKITILDAEGRVQGDYFHGGWFYDWLLCDLDKDGYQDILAAGTHNGVDRACLLVLDCRQISGYPAHMSLPEIESRNVMPLQEKAYLLLPVDPVNRLRSFLRPSVADIDAFDTHLQLRMYVSAPDCLRGTIFFLFDYSLKFLTASAGDDYLRLCRCARESGWVDYTFDPADITALGEEVLYWDGEAWTTTPTIHPPALNP